MAYLDWRHIVGAVLATRQNIEANAAVLGAALQAPLAELKLPVRIVNVLEEHGAILVRDLVRLNYATLMSMTNFGGKTLTAVIGACASWGSSLRSGGRRRARRRSARRSSKAYRSTRFDTSLLRLARQDRVQRETGAGRIAPPDSTSPQH